MSDRNWKIGVGIAVGLIIFATICLMARDSVQEKRIRENTGKMMQEYQDNMFKSFGGD